MLRNNRYGWLVLVLPIVVGLWPATGFGQIDDPWVVFVDPWTGSECGIVNATNAELIVMYQTGEMVIVTGADVILRDLIVNSNNEVSYLGEPAGVIDFFEDGDGLPAVFWTTLAGTVITVDTFTAEPFDSGRAPDEIRATGCDACAYVDDSIYCEDTSDDDAANDVADAVADTALEYLCGTGSGLAAAVGMILLPFVGLARRRG